MVSRKGGTQWLTRKIMDTMRACHLTADRSPKPRILTQVPTEGTTCKDLFGKGTCHNWGRQLGVIQTEMNYPLPASPPTSPPHRLPRCDNYARILSITEGRLEKSRLFMKRQASEKRQPQPLDAARTRVSAHHARQSHEAIRHRRT